MKILNPYIIELAPTLSQHWYYVWKATPTGKKGKYLGVFPSSTTILNAYPQSAQLTQWIAEQGWNESQKIKSEAGEDGTLIHKGIEYLLDGGEIIQDGYIPGSNRMVSLKSYWKLSTFVNWYNEYQPTIIAKEMKIFNKKGGYAGTLDALIEVRGEIVLVDWKSSSSIHENFPLQFASYAVAIEQMTDLKIDQTACLQLGAKNKNGYRYVMYPDWKDHYKVFQNVQATWKYDNFDSKVNAKEAPVLELPSILKLSQVSGRDAGDTEITK